MSSRLPTATRAAAGVVAILGPAGVAHFVRPQFFDPLVPSWVPGSPRTVTHLSGVAEIASAVLVAIPRTRRLGGAMALATFAGVFPANIQAAIDGGIEGAPPPIDNAVAAWVRLPMQFPMFWLAWKVIRGDDS